MLSYKFGTSPEPMKLAFIPFLALLSTVASLAAATPLPLENPGFENGTQGWRVMDGEGSTSEVNRDSAREGEGGLHISDQSPSLNSKIISDLLPVEAGKTYRITFWARTTTPNRMGVFLCYVKADGQLFEDGRRPYVNVDGADGQWKEYTLEAPAPEEAASVKVWIHSYSKTVGEVDFDDFILEEVGGPAMSATEKPAMAVRDAPAPGPVEKIPGTPPVIILKLDDLRATKGTRPIDPHWQKIADFIKDRKIKASIGIICDSLNEAGETSLAWIRDLHDTGLVEFWFHGYDHQGWLDADGKAYAEFRKRPYEEQKRRFDLAQKLAHEKLGFHFTAFGPPGFVPPPIPGTNTSEINTPKPPAFTGDNFGFDSETIRVMQEDPHMKVWMYPTPLTWLYPSLDEAAGAPLNPPDKIKVLDRVWNANIETPLFVPNAEKLKEAYVQNVGKRDYLVLQGHPQRWDEGRFAQFVQIVDFLTAQGAVFVTPSQYGEASPAGTTVR